MKEVALGDFAGGRLLIDLRNIYRSDEALRHVFRHIAIGTGAESAHPDWAGSKFAATAL